jgi:hypothetical protein
VLQVLKEIQVLRVHKEHLQVHKEPQVLWAHKELRVPKV